MSTIALELRSRWKPDVEIADPDWRRRWFSWAEKNDKDDRQKIKKLFEWSN